MTCFYKKVKIYISEIFWFARDFLLKTDHSFMFGICNLEKKVLSMINFAFSSLAENKSTLKAIGQRMQKVLKTHKSAFGLINEGKNIAD